MLEKEINDMIENKQNEIKYREVENLQGYVQELLNNGSQIVVGEKTARIAARPGIPDKERIISWSVDRNGKPVLEKEAVVSVDESGVPDWVVTKIDEQNQEIVDANGHLNQWIISNVNFRKKYEAVSEIPGVYKSVDGPQKFLYLQEGIHVVQWGGEWNVDAGGYINITNPDDLYVIAGRDFNDTYRVC